MPGLDRILAARSAWTGALAAAAIMLVAPAAADASSAVLEYDVGGSLPVHFTTEGGAMTAEMAGFESLVHCAASSGEGDITGPRSTVSSYRFTGCVTQRGSNQKCKSEGAQEEEIRAGPVEAELVWIDQARHEVGELLDPHGGTYIAFECGGESAEGRGPFLSPVTPIDTDATSFTATLSESASIQAPDEYEGTNGEKLQATPMGKRGSQELVTTGVESTFVVHPDSPVEIKAMTAQEVEAQQRAEEARQREQMQHEEEAALAAAAANRRRGEAAFALAIAAKLRQQEQANAASQSRRPTLSIVKAKLTARKLLLTLRLSTAGVVSVSGPRLKKTSRTLGAGLRHLSLTIAGARTTHRRPARITIRLHTPSATVSHTLTLRL